MRARGALCSGGAGAPAVGAGGGDAPGVERGDVAAGARWEARVTPHLSAALDDVGRALVDHRAEQEELTSRLAAHRAAGVDVGLRLSALATRARRMEHPRHLGAGELGGPRSALRDGAPGSVAPGRDATESSLITMGLSRPRKATV